ncbi:MAG TPA: HAD-IIIA family hydrolase, partial [Pseudonocardiaceae bacterium]|nr:HAD-IIIA family hydrolase [Pseudonocardiaceae bacterium]
GDASDHSHRHSRPREIVVVDDRPAPGKPLPVGPTVQVLRTGGRGPAAARNAGWRTVRAEWVAFLDDDVVPGPDWAQRITEDLSNLPPDVGASQGRIEVPLPTDRRPTDVERGTAGLAIARWITADMAYRRTALHRVGGFDERFGRAYREDADLALRVIAAGYRIVAGRRCTTHPVRRAGPLASVGAQRGNADDALMRRRHGPGWRERIGDSPGRLRRHALTTAAGVLALGAASCRYRSLASAAALAWAALTAEFALHRILPGPRGVAEIGRMVATSVAIPSLACWHRLAGELRWRRVLLATAVPAAVLFDRDGTLIHDVPYNTDPAAVRPVAGVKQALDRLRDLGIPIGVVSNQSGVARGLISPEQLEQVNARVMQLLGPFDVLCVCVHAEHDGCGCRKPAPGLVHAAAAQLGVPVHRCVVIGDIGADVTAAAAAGAHGILVPNARTRRAEVLAVRVAMRTVAPDVPTAVNIALSGRLALSGRRG